MQPFETLHVRKRMVARWTAAVACSLASTAFLFLTCLTAAAAPPANDTCAGAVTIPSNPTFPYLTAVVTNMNEATLTGDPLPECIVGAARGIWYKFTPTQTGFYTISTGADTATTAFDTILGVFSAPGGCGTVTNQIACNDDTGGSNNRAGLGVTLGANTNYFILVWLSQADDDTTVPLSVQLRIDRPATPANDTCATAEVIPANAGFPQKSSIVETVRAGSELDSPASSCGTGFRSVWFKFTPPTTNTYILSTGPETATTVFDTLMVLYSSSGNCSTLSEVACSDNGEGRGSLFRTLNAGTTYYIEIYDQSTDPVIAETFVQLNVATPIAPTVTTLPTISVTSTGAVLNGIVNPNGLQSRFWYEWGLSTAYNNTSTVRLLFPGTVAIMTNALVSGFQPNATYHYRMVATNTLGRSNGGDQTFIWKTNRPAIANLERLLSGNIRFAFSANSHQIYNIEASTNLVEWLYLGPAVETPLDSGTFLFTHIGAGAGQKRFYRVTSP